jgi:rRNA maturation protein Rpf1
MAQKVLVKQLNIKITSVNNPSQQALDSFARELLRQINQKTKVKRD